jgi:hypothetical protein
VGGPSHDGGFGVCGNNSAFAYATGNFRNSAQFGPDISLVSSGLSDIWLAKFEKNTGTSADDDDADNSVNEGNTFIPVKEEFQTYPNPFNNQIVVGVPRYTTQLTIYNMLGQIVLQRNVDKAEKQIPLEFIAHPAGMYTIQLKGDYGVITGKIEKQSY